MISRDWRSPTYVTQFICGAHFANSRLHPTSVDRGTTTRNGPFNPKLNIKLDRNDTDWIVFPIYYSLFCFVLVMFLLIIIIIVVIINYNNGNDNIYIYMYVCIYVCM